MQNQLNMFLDNYLSTLPFFLVGGNKCQGCLTPFITIPYVVCFEFPPPPHLLLLLLLFEKILPFVFENQKSPGFVENIGLVGTL